MAEQLPAHVVTRMWTVAVIRCADCRETWEQPMYADDGSTWVCPLCLHGAPAERAGARHVA